MRNYMIGAITGATIATVLAFATFGVIENATAQNSSGVAITTTGNAMLRRHELAINQMRDLIRRTCAIRQWEDGSARWESGDDTRFMCLEFVSTINRNGRG